MKATFLLIPILLMNACKTTTETVSENSSDSVVVEEVNSCPTKGNCIITLHKNKDLLVKQDGIGANYPELVEGTHMVIEYNYTEKAPEGIADGDYAETIHFEIPASITSLTKENHALSEVKALYGKHCFCRGQAGYYPVTIGKLVVKKTKSSLHFDLEFQIEATSQVVTRISETIPL